MKTNQETRTLAPHLGTLIISWPIRTSTTAPAHLPTLTLADTGEALDLNDVTGRVERAIPDNLSRLDDAAWTEFVQDSFAAGALWKH